MEYSVVYVEILVLCAIFALIILSRLTGDLGTNLEIRVFKMIMRIFIVMMAADGYTQLQYNDVIEVPLITVAVGYSTYQFFLGVLSILWMIYAELQITGEMPKKKVMIAGIWIPSVIIFVLAYGSIWTGWYYTFDENAHFVRGPLFPVMNAIAYAYFIVTTVHAFIAYARETSLARKRRLLLIAGFIVSPVIGATLQLVVGGYPFLQPSVCIAFMIIFVNIQSAQINVDALTGLNNRKSMENYVTTLIQNATEENPFYFYIIDADKFKTINDTYGHIEGDKALCYIADALRMTADNFNGFISRYGGDEFIAVVTGAKIGQPEDFVTQMEINLATVCEKHGISYPLKVSTGYVTCTTHDSLIGTLIAEADQMLYAQKAESAA